MTLPKVARVFFAIELPDEAKITVGKFVGLLKKKSKSHSIRWTKTENFHITLQFLAEIKEEDIVELIANVRQEVRDIIQKSSFAFGKIHLFPNPYRPRVIVLEIDSQDEIAKLAEAIGRGISKTHYDIETRPFRGHLTLGRIKQPHGIDLKFLAEVAPPTLAEMTLSEVILFQSEPTPDGSKYTVLEKITW